MILKNTVDRFPQNASYCVLDDQVQLSRLTRSANAVKIYVTRPSRRLLALTLVGIDLPFRLG